MLIVLLVLVLILFGGSFYGTTNAGWAPGYGYGGYGIGGLLLIVLLLYLFGVL